MLPEAKNLHMIDVCMFVHVYVDTLVYVACVHACLYIWVYDVFMYSMYFMCVPVFMPVDMFVCYVRIWLFM